MACLDPKYRIVIQCQNIIHVLKEHEIVQPKLRLLNEVTDGNDYNINETYGDITEELIHVETEEIVLNESASKLEKPNQILENNQNEDVNQTKVQIEPSSHSVRKN